ncbi:hypothetical protein GOP47_0008294 [Adiantum capillus-veneris]|uniref:Beta-fructofuranosidase n=1 Tax=Adiantum capillus-veneris TaxID=13818 RepID=A0A9D4UYF6_ADICA|nr:hypothetical protein GOP47_0008294 [Adiantum capillus-veneris]
MGIMDLLEERWPDLTGEMPIKIAYPTLEGHEWRIMTGCDPKNTRWSYHNGGSWLVLIWLFTAACIKIGRSHMARKAMELLESRISKDHWPEYYDEAHHADESRSSSFSMVVVPGPGWFVDEIITYKRPTLIQCCVLSIHRDRKEVDECEFV